MSTPFSFFGSGIGLGLGDFHLGSQNSSHQQQQQQQQPGAGGAASGTGRSRSVSASSSPHSLRSSARASAPSTPHHGAQGPAAGAASSLLQHHTSQQQHSAPVSSTALVAASSGSSGGVTYRIQLFPHREAIGIPGQAPVFSAGFNFAPIEKDVKVGTTIRIGRKVDRGGRGNTSAAVVGGAPVAAPAAAQGLDGEAAVTAQRDEAHAPLLTTDLSVSAPSSAAASMALLHVRRRNSGQGPGGGAPASTSVNAAAADGTAEHQQQQQHGEAVPATDFIAFRSKVVSRTHAEMWVTPSGQLLFRDVGSSSGTFLNRVRLSQSGRESRPFTVKSGDVIQLGVDYQGRQEEVYKCVMMKVFLSVKARDKPKINPQRLRTALRTLLAAMNPSAEDPLDVSCTECCICLTALSPLQSLFLAPCSHCFHYRCVMSLLGSNVMFQCPLCRQVANLVPPIPEDDDDETDADVGVEDEFTAALLAAASTDDVRAGAAATASTAAATAATAAVATSASSELESGPSESASGAAATDDGLPPLPLPPTAAGSTGEPVSSASARRADGSGAEDLNELVDSCSAALAQALQAAAASSVGRDGGGGMDEGRHRQLQSLAEQLGAVSAGLQRLQLQRGAAAAA
ncbi:hypothetical protein HK405_011817, partial [Cladochytrium tenue]